MDKLEALHIDVKATNGRVRSLEKWRSFITGGGGGGAGNASASGGTGGSGYIRISWR